MRVHTHREQTEHIRGKLAEELQTLMLLETELRLRPFQDVRQRVRLDRVSVAIDHLHRCLDELETATRQ
jgi:hypothetical protein